ncbi:MAG TPA: trypsin-like peptidase domain-containing protein [Planctomycetota bacterium]|nr:trypsin-like peptidase domain-containing protein [Planctomycetota bacterium]
MRVWLAVPLMLGLLLSMARGGEAIPEGMLQKLKDATAFIKVESVRGRSSGSGFVMSSAGGVGYLVTNAHVVQPAGRNATSIKVVFRSGNPGECTTDAQIVGMDDDRDLAILKVAGDKLPQALDLKSNLAVRETLPVFILGYPFGDRLAARDGNPEISIARGSISSIRRGEFGETKFLQIDGDVNPGNSGGPIVDGNGALIGVSVAKVTGTNIGIAIPPRELEEMLLGRVAGITLTQISSEKGAAKFKATARLIDPMGQMRSVSVSLFPKDKITTPAKADAAGIWGYFYPNQSFPLTVDKGAASGEFTVNNPAEGTVTYLMQICYVRGDGKSVFTQPGDLQISFAGAAAVAPPVVVTPGPGPGPGPLPGLPAPRPSAGAGDMRMTLGTAAAEALKAAANAKDPGAEGLSFRLPDEVSDAVLAGGGAYLVLRFKVLNKLGVFDIAQGAMHKEIPTPAPGVVMGAGGNLAVFYVPGTGAFEKWNILTGEKLGGGQNRIGGQISHLVMGLAEEREALISYSVGREALDQRKYAMLDLSGFGITDIAANFHNASHRDQIQIRANASLTTVTMWATSHSPSGFVCGRRAGVGQPWTVKYEHNDYGSLVPSDDGAMIFSSSSGVFGADAHRLQDFHGSLTVPIQGSNLFLQIEKDLTTHVRAPDMQDRVKFFKAPECARPQQWGWRTMSGDRLVIASGPLGRVVFLDNNALRLRIMDLGLKVNGDRLEVKPGFELPGGGPAQPGLAIDPVGGGNRLPDQVSDVRVAYGGALLALRYKTQNRIGILDVASGRLIKEIPTEVPDSVVAAGGRFLVVYSPRSRSLEKWDLSSMTRVAQGVSKVNGQITHMAMGMDEEREALISYAVGSGALDRRVYAMLDLSSFAHQDSAEGFHNSSYRDNIHIRTNPKLTCVTMWASSHTPSGFILCRRGAVGEPWKVTYEHESFGALNPTADGLSVLATNGGLYGLQAKPIKMFQGSQLLPVHGADLFLQIDGRGRVTVMDLDFKEKAPAFQLPDGFQLKPEVWARGSVYGDELVMASARANKVVCIDNNSLKIHALPLGLQPADVPAAVLPRPVVPGSGQSEVPGVPAPPAGSGQPAPTPAPVPAPTPAPTPAPGPAGAADDGEMKKTCQAWLNMADNFERSGMGDKAKEYLQKIIDKYPNSSFAETARNRLPRIR